MYRRLCNSDAYHAQYIDYAYIRSKVCRALVRTGILYMADRGVMFRRRPYREVPACYFAVAPLSRRSQFGNFPLTLRRGDAGL